MAKQSTQVPCAECGEYCECRPDSYDAHEAEVTLCDSCDDHYVWCDICRIRVSDDDLCRHVCWDSEDGGYGGCGYSGESSVEERYKDSFFAMLDKIGVEAAQALKRSLENHRYYFQYWGPMFGPRYLTAELLQSDGQRRNYGDCFVEDLTDEEEAAMTRGMQWLVSLWSGGDLIRHDPREPETAKFDLMTASWIDEWLQVVAQRASSA